MASKKIKASKKESKSVVREADDDTVIKGVGAAKDAKAAVRSASAAAKRARRSHRQAQDREVVAGVEAARPPLAKPPMPVFSAGPARTAEQQAAHEIFRDTEGRPGRERKRIEALPEAERAAIRQTKADELWQFKHGDRPAGSEEDRRLADVGKPNENTPQLNALRAARNAQGIADLGPTVKEGPEPKPAPPRSTQFTNVTDTGPMQSAVGGAGTPTETEVERRRQNVIPTGSRTGILDFKASTPRDKIAEKYSGTEEYAKHNLARLQEVGTKGKNKGKFRGLAGSENNILDHAVGLVTRDRNEAIKTGKRVNGIFPDHPEPTRDNVGLLHQTRVARIMHRLGVTEEHIKLQGADLNIGHEDHVAGLDKLMQAHADSMIMEKFTPAPGETYKDPKTGDTLSKGDKGFPKVMKRSKGKRAFVKRNPETLDIEPAGTKYLGQAKRKFAAGPGETHSQWSLTPTPKDMSLVDHIRNEMLRDRSGDSETPRARRQGALAAAGFLGGSSRQVHTTASGPMQSVNSTVTGRTISRQVDPSMDQVLDPNRGRIRYGKKNLIQGVPQASVKLPDKQGISRIISPIGATETSYEAIPEVKEPIIKKARNAPIRPPGQSRQRSKVYVSTFTGVTQDRETSSSVTSRRAAAETASLFSGTIPISRQPQPQTLGGTDEELRRGGAAALRTPRRLAQSQGKNVSDMYLEGTKQHRDYAPYSAPSEPTYMTASPAPTINSALELRAGGKAQVARERKAAPLNLSAGDYRESPRSLGTEGPSGRTVRGSRRTGNLYQPELPGPDKKTRFGEITQKAGDEESDNRFAAATTEYVRASKLTDPGKRSAAIDAIGVPRPTSAMSGGQQWLGSSIGTSTDAVMDSSKKEDGKSVLYGASGLKPVPAGGTPLKDSRIKPTKKELRAAGWATVDKTRVDKIMAGSDARVAAKKESQVESEAVGLNPSDNKSPRQSKAARIKAERDSAE